MPLPSQPFDLRVTADGDQHVVVAVTGELDLATAPRLRTVIGDAMGTGVRRVTIDLGATSFIDSTGLGALLWARHRLEALGGDLVATHPRANVARAIELAGLEELVSG